MSRPTALFVANTERRRFPFIDFYPVPVVVGSAPTSVSEERGPCGGEITIHD